MKQIIFATLLLVLAVGCGSFEAKRVDAETYDAKGLKITDNSMSADTRQAVKDILKQISAHKGFQRYLAQNGGNPPKLFIADVQNQTSEAYFPIADLNDELLNELSASGEFVLIDAAAREKILGELKYQNDGMVDPKTAKQVGRQTGADLMIFGSVYMKPERRDGKTIKEYSVNLRMTDIEKAVEVMRARTQVFKYSEKKSMGL
jgi:hypothetical protein